MAGLRELLLVVVCCVLWASAAVNPHHKPRRHHQKADKPRGANPQPDCDPDVCGPDATPANSDCRCASVHDPLEADLVDVPQFVVLSFDDAVTIRNYEFYIELLNTYKNPNNCPITMTYFITHQYNDYAKMNELHRLGNEIAVHSVSHVPDVENYWRPADYDTWFSEIDDSKQMIMRYGLIPEDDIKGWRTPFLEVGGDDMYKALIDSGFQYDSSISTFKYTNWYTDLGENKPHGALFPFTLDSNMTLECAVGRCPKKAYPGFWVTPMIDLNDPRPMPEESPNLRAQCNMLDSCVGDDTTSTGEWDCPDRRCKDNIVDWLKREFNMNYKNNRAPFGLYAHYSWFLIDEIIGSQHKEAYLEFLDYLVGLDDVYIVSQATVIEYMKDPHYAMDLPYWDPVQCRPPPATNCPDPIACTYESNLPFEAHRVTMTICTRPCPPTYPWLGDVEGLRLQHA